MIQHPTKAKRKNVLKILAAILLFLLLLCGILKITGASCGCETVITKMKDFIDGVKARTMNPKDALQATRTKLADVWSSFKNLRPVVAGLGALGTLGDKAKGLFTSGPPPPEKTIKVERSITSTALKDKIKRDLSPRAAVYLIGLIDNVVKEGDPIGHAFDSNDEIKSWVDVTD